MMLLVSLIFIVSGVLTIIDKQCSTRGRIVYIGKDATAFGIILIIFGLFFLHAFIRSKLRKKQG